jgi:FkbM family methyltransferase
VKSRRPGKGRSILKGVSLDSLNGDLHESEILRLAGELAWTRPLVPYPGWRFDADWDNPHLAFQLRRKIWKYFQQRKQHVPLITKWYCGLRLHLYLSNDISKQLYIAGCFEPNEFAFLDKVLAPGMTFIDAGANDGLFTLFAAQRVGPTGQVWAFEPSEREFLRLRRNLQLNQLNNVRSFKLALAQRQGEAEIKIADDEHSGQNTLGDFAYQIELARCERVPTSRLDDLVHQECLPRVDIIKLDVEGSELSVLAGASGVLRKLRPLLLLEINENALQFQGTSGATLVEFLRSNDYEIYGFDQTTGQPLPMPQVEVSDNIVAMPAKKASVAMVA